MNRFISENKDNWQRLEDLLGMISGTGLRGLSRMEVREFGELYRRAAADLAIARAETRDPKLINYLNSLVIRAHGKIYRSEGDGAGAIRRYFTFGLPDAFRLTLPFITVAFALFMLCGIASFLLCYFDPTFANLLGLSDVETAAASNHQWWMRLNEANQIGSSEILTNNIGVTFYAFALGAFFGIGTLYIIILNGLSIGGALGVTYRVDPAFGNALVNFMSAHGPVELACIFIAAGAGMAIGYTIFDPGDLTRAEAMKRRAFLAVRLILGCALFLFISGIIEGFISPSALHPAVKYSVGATTGIALLSYLFLVGRNSAPAGQ